MDRLGTSRLAVNAPSERDRDSLAPLRACKVAVECAPCAFQRKKGSIKDAGCCFAPISRASSLLRPISPQHRSRCKEGAAGADHPASAGLAMPMLCGKHVTRYIRVITISAHLPRQISRYLPKRRLRDVETDAASPQRYKSRRLGLETLERRGPIDRAVRSSSWRRCMPRPAP
jgi:hypothetical protein